MRLKTPRIPPLSDAEFTPELRAATGMGADARGMNLVRTLAQAPEALGPFLAWSRHVLVNNTLPPRQREIIVVRIGTLCRSGYELAQHMEIGRAAGLSDADFQRIRTGAKAGWDDVDAALIRACDELVANHFISETTWQTLAGAFSTRQLMDVVMTAAQYIQLADILNTLGVQLEPGVAPVTPP